MCDKSYEMSGALQPEPFAPAVVDIAIMVNGTIASLRPLTEAGVDALDDLDFEPWRWQSGAIVIEPRFVDAIVDGLRDRGLVVVV